MQTSAVPSRGPAHIEAVTAPWAARGPYLPQSVVPLRGPDAGLLTCARYRRNNGVASTHHLQMPAHPAGDPRLLEQPAPVGRNDVALYELALVLRIHLIMLADTAMHGGRALAVVDGFLGPLLLVVGVVVARSAAVVGIGL